MSEKHKRRWYQFSLRTMLFVFVVMAVAAWYGYRLRLLEQERRILEHERQQLAGKWELMPDSHKGIAARFSHLRAVPTIDFSDSAHQLLVPSGGLGRIDFQIVNGPGASLGIYSRNGDEITVAQSPPNHPRPTNFEETKDVIVWKAIRRRPVEWWTDRSELSKPSAPAPNPPKP